MGLLDDAIREHLELKRRRGGDPAEIERAERDALGPVRREPEPLQPAGFDETEGVDHELAPAFDEESEYGPPFDELEEHDFEDPYAHTPGGLPTEPEPALPHGAVGTGPEVPSAPEPLDVAEEHDPWVSHPGSEQLDEFDEFDEPFPETERDAAPAAGHDTAAMPHEELEPEDYDDAGHDPLPEPVVPPADATPPPVAPPPPGVPPASSAPPPRRPAPREPDHLNQETAEYRLPPEDRDEEHEDVLEETPEFLQDAPEHDRLWFEQRPPRDFDFDN
jgi:hypothetical protein